MIMTSLDKKFTSFALLLLCLTACWTLLFSSCDIEETKTETANIGMIFVTAITESGSPIEGAAISLDGIAQNKSTPDTIDNVSAGQHEVSVFKIGYVQASLAVNVVADQMANAEISLTVAHDGTIILQNAPEGIVLLLNGFPYDVTSALNEFVDMGFGNFDVSAYLPGLATDLPARWRAELSEANPIVTLTPTFTEVEAGSEVASLASDFLLPSLEDSSLYGLSNYRGKVVLVTFYFNNCAPCLIEFPHIQDAWEDPDFSGQFQVLAVNGQDPWTIFVMYPTLHPELGLTFPLLHDVTQQVRASDYNVTSHPANFLIDQTGVIRYRWGSISKELLYDAIQNLLIVPAQ
jgi:peroxiredoxin